MAATPQTQAIQVADQLISLSQDLMGVYQAMLQLDAAWTDQGVAATLAAMATSALNADGTIGTIDGTPVSSHPINATGMSRAISSTQLGQLKTILDGIVSYVGGSAVSTQVGARAILNVAVGG
jgi:hypothetical protein